jgi:hypothetical protein
MADLAVITPTRGRPERFAALVSAIHRSAAGSVDIWAGLDADDPSEYLAALRDRPGSDAVVGTRGDRRSLSAWTNLLALEALDGWHPPRYLASLGDDHLPRTVGWNRTLIEAIEALPGGVGIAYGNDLLQGENLPTAWVVSADLVRAVGWMMLPTAQHMYVDNAVLALGKATGQIVYRPDVVIEHLHPSAGGKAAWDASYRESNTSERYERDRAAFEAWRRDGLAADVEKVKALVESRMQPCP